MLRVPPDPCGLLLRHDGAAPQDPAAAPRAGPRLAPLHGQPVGGCARHFRNPDVPACARLEVIDDGTPMSRETRSLKACAIRSFSPPGGHGTTKRMKRAGWAMAGWAMAGASERRSQQEHSAAGQRHRQAPKYRLPSRTRHHRPSGRCLKVEQASQVNLNGIVAQGSSVGRTNKLLRGHRRRKNGNEMKQLPCAY